MAFARLPAQVLPHTLVERVDPHVLAEHVAANLRADALQQPADSRQFLRFVIPEHTDDVVIRPSFFRHDDRVESRSAGPNTVTDVNLRESIFTRQHSANGALPVSGLAADT